MNLHGNVFELNNLKVSDRALKEEHSEDVKKYVMSLSYHAELSSTLKKKSFRDARVALDNAHINIDAMNCNNEVVHQVLSGKAEKFLQDREKIKSLYQICSELPNVSDLKRFPTTDQVHITLLAHSICKKVVFGDDIFNIENGGISMPFVDLYKRNISDREKIKNIRQILKPITHKLMGSEGKFFYGIKFKKSDFISKDIMDFLIAPYNKGKNNIERIFTDFCAFLLYGKNSSYEVLNYDVREKTDVLMEIGYKDFAIRCNVFKCKHEAHTIKNVIAVVSVVDENGKSVKVEVTAGFCSECNVYFILESTYKKLTEKGTIMCRVTDEKKYAKSKFMNGQELARESILMQYGYNVSKVEGLSEKQRWKILGIILDNNILSKSEIISYLDFIKQRLSMDNMKVAISKWEDDRKFVERYKSEKSIHIGVKSMHRGK